MTDSRKSSVISTHLFKSPGTDRDRPCQISCFIYSPRDKNPNSHAQINNKRSAYVLRLYWRVGQLIILQGGKPRRSCRHHSEFPPQIISIPNVYLCMGHAPIFNCQLINLPTRSPINRNPKVVSFISWNFPCPPWPHFILQKDSLEIKLKKCIWMDFYQSILISFLYHLFDLERNKVNYTPSKILQ